MTRTVQMLADKLVSFVVPEITAAACCGETSEHCFCQLPTGWVCRRCTRSCNCTWTCRTDVICPGCC